MVGFAKVVPSLLSLFLIIQGGVATPSPEPDVTIVARSVVDSVPLLKRQFNGPTVSSSDSSSCQSQCTGFSNSLASCSNATTNAVTCYCSQTVVNNWATCIDCALAVDSSVSQSDQQSALNSFVSACQTEGVSLNTVTLKASKSSGLALKAGVIGVSAAIGAVVFMV